MNQRTFSTCLSLLALLYGSGVSAQPAFPPPPGGWTYVYQGDQLIVGDQGTGWTSLDGTWTHDNGSDAWDGSIIGGTFSGAGGWGNNAPGGAILLTNENTTFLRLQDTGDPRDYGYSSDPSNRKVYFGHSINADSPLKAPTIMRDGVTLTFRARIPTLAKAGPPLDPLHRDGQQASGVQPYPENGDGYVTSDGGKGNFVVREGGNGADIPPAAIAFSFTQTTDTTGGNPNTGQAGFAGLTFNEFNGNVPTANVNFGQGTKTNVVPFDPTEWHELYIVIRDDPADIGSHEAFIFVDGNLRPYVFKITGGTGADMNDSFLAMGGSATPQNWALDVDWFGYKDEAVFPPGALLPPSIFGFAPAHRTMFHPAANGLRFSASALMPTNTLPAAGIKMIVNGQDVSSQLVLTGDDNSKSRTVTYNGLQPNTIYSATYIVVDSGGLGTTNEITLDTFVESQAKVFEAEDYNYQGGQFENDPVPSSYAIQSGFPGVDFADTTPSTSGTYRFSDAVDTATTADTLRSKFVTYGQNDYQIGGIYDGEWWNYTGTFTPGNYRVYVRAASTAAQRLRLDRVADGTVTNQSLRFVGTFPVTGTGNLNVFEYFPLSDVQGRPVVMALSGQATFRLTALGANNNLALNYLMFVPDSVPADPLVAASPWPGATAVRGDAPVEVAIYDGGAPVTPTSVKLSLNGAEVAATVTKEGSVTLVKYTPTPFWLSGSSNWVSLQFSDGTARSYDWSFQVTTYGLLTPAMKVTDATLAGFVWHVHQNETNTEANHQKADNILGGILVLPNLADPNALGPASGPGTPANPGNGMMTFRIPTVINLGQTAFDNMGNFVPDEQMPGIPGTTLGLDGIVADIRAFIELPAGMVTMGVNSDDGFRTTAGFLNDAPLLVGEYNGGRSSADTIFQIGVQETGVYAFRTVYYEGGGNANVEWFTVKPDGTKVLINDTANGGFRAYQQGTIPTKPIENVVLTARRNAAGRIVLEWTAGTLQAADTVNGTYQAVAGATSPWEVDPAAAQQKFYRVLVR